MWGVSLNLEDQVKTKWVRRAGGRRKPQPQRHELDCVGRRPIRDDRRRLAHEKVSLRPHRKSVEEAKARALKGITKGWEYWRDGGLGLVND